MTWPPDPVRGRTGELTPMQREDLRWAVLTAGKPGLRRTDLVRAVQNARARCLEDDAVVVPGGPS